MAQAVEEVSVAAATAAAVRAVVEEAGTVVAAEEVQVVGVVEAAADVDTKQFRVDRCL